MDRKCRPCLPGQVVVVVERVVAKNLGIGARAEVTGIVADALSRKSGIKLVANERNSDFLITCEAKLSGRIGRDAVVPAYARESHARFVDDRRMRRCEPSFHRRRESDKRFATGKIPA